MKTYYPEATHGIIHRVQGSLFGYQGWPSVSKDEKGTLYAVVSGFRVRHICPFSKTCMHISKDGGYPCTLEMEDGSLLTVYYQKVPGDEKTSFLYTKWKLNK